MIRRPPRSTQSRSSAASDVYKRQDGVDQLGHIVIVEDLAWLPRVRSDAEHRELRISGSWDRRQIEPRFSLVAHGRRGDRPVVTADPAIILPGARAVDPIGTVQRCFT